ncbi:hypothetical protein FB45DRAFT_784922 [Roridomyces roridus]|uniref:Transmembrane protein n=1 Tax=Roridomyces roridus TaxID=1738132 RepID=A0AAD7CCV9_9AGAR|nr:hypothetical protein FB45DRAFT_784922 [Roridomyces roridus]
MAFAQPRKIVVDDSDGSILYSPNDWFVADPSTLKGGNFGPIYNGTSHSASSNVTLSFPFSGSSISVYGTLNIKTNADNTTDPTWTCFIDEIPISNGNPTFKFYENNWELCVQSAITPGPHNLTIQVASKGQTFYLDNLIYTPTPDVVFDEAVVLYPTSDSSVSFGSGWDTFGGENGTQTAGSQVSLNFHGTSVTPYAFVPTERPHNSSWATYSIDGGPAVNFTLAGLDPSPSASTSYNVILFTTPTLPSATHNLVIEYGGDGQHTPLVVQGFYVTNTTSPTLAIASAGSATSPSASASAIAGKGHAANGGAIAGGVIGALFLLSVLAVIGLWLWRRRQRRGDAQSGSSAATSTPLPGMGQAYPFPGASAGATSTTTYPYVHRVHQHPASDVASSSHGTGTLPRATRTNTISAYTDYPGSSIFSGDGNTSVGAVGGETVRTEFESMPAPPLVLASVPDLPAPTSKLERERAAADAFPSTSSYNHAQRALVRHEDSGVRLPTPPEEEFVELPPGYSVV